jgi:transcription initiation factor TFIIIB Brf1 subunit/transcription initiation factor TFIIB
MFHLDNTSSTKGCKNAVQIINSLEEEKHNSDKTQFGCTKPISFIERYCSRLNINEELTKVCKFIAIKIDNKNLIPENTPHSIAAGIIYFITQTCGLNISKTDIYQISDISEVTINKCFKKLNSKKEDLIPKVILNKYSIK